MLLLAPTVTSSAQFAGLDGSTVKASRKQDFENPIVANSVIPGVAFGLFAIKSALESDTSFYQPDLGFLPRQKDRGAGSDLQYTSSLSIMLSFLLTV